MASPGEDLRWWNAPDDDQIYLSSGETEQLVLQSSVSADTRMRRA